jgi:hypothetical protein
VSYAGSTGAGQYQNNYVGNVATTSQNHTKLSSTLNTGTKEAQVTIKTVSLVELYVHDYGCPVSLVYYFLFMF